MPAGATYEPIATYTVGSNLSSIVFSGITQSYTDLVIAGRWRASTSGSSLKMRFNSDSGGNYRWVYVAGGSTTSASAGQAVTSNLYCGEDVSTASGFASFVINIGDYSRSSIFKPTIATGSAPGTDVLAIGSSYWSTSAITAIEIYIDSSNNYAFGTNFTLYGITAA